MVRESGGGGSVVVVAGSGEVGSASHKGAGSKLVLDEVGCSFLIMYRLFLLFTRED